MYFKWTWVETRWVYQKDKYQTYYWYPEYGIPPAWIPMNKTV